jgi:hypothetical protein
MNTLDDADRRGFAGDVYAIKSSIRKAYVPYQKDTRLYSEDEALMKGTAFVALLEPYSGNVSGGTKLCPLL